MSPGNFLRAYSDSNLKSLTRKRQGEIKLGENIAAAGSKWQRSLENHKGEYVLIGIPEDIGVRANLGRPGAHSAFVPALTAFLNQQQNHYMDPSQILVLGEIECRDLMKKASRVKNTSMKSVDRLRELVSLLDERVSDVLSHVFASGRVPIIIGGGHNNAYGVLRALSATKKRPVNAINCDPHLDFRPREGRHSGNSFSYAFSEDILARYAVFGMHEQYNSEFATGEFAAHRDRLWYQSFESVFVRGEVSFDRALANCLSFVNDNVCGVELDLDAITNMPSSARTSSGISPLQARQYVHRCAANLDCGYLHIAEGAPVLSHIRADMKTGKFIAYLVSDFIKARSSRSAGS